ncbi:MAG: NifU family protein [Gemmatimonadota bacterium]|nr:NifU family protein [Gemmatimonadota bacterium]
MAGPRGGERRIERLDAIVEALSEHSDEGVREGVGELVAGLRWLHAEGLGRMVDLLAEDTERFRRALDDPRIGNLLLLYDLVTVDGQARAEEALDEMRPFLRSHGGEAEVLGVDEGVVRLRLLGACDGCPSSRATLRQGIERALAERLPGFRGMEVAGEGNGDAAEGSAGLDGPDRRRERAEHGEPVSFVPVERLVALEKRVRNEPEEEPPSGPARERETRAGSMDELTDGLHGFLADDYPILLVRSGGTIRAYQNTCPGSILPLHLGRVEGGVLACPWHGCRFDLATGARVGGDGPPLHRLEAEVVDGEVRVRF